MTEQMPCGCCQGTGPETPEAISNRPGLDAISYRPGTWAEFKAAMLDALSAIPALAGLRTRGDDDFSIALLDAWALSCDILTFYTERIANESYLRTATELVSVGELAKLIGYKLRPGLAASTALAFTMESPPALPSGASGLGGNQNTTPSGSPASVTLATGTRAQTVPDPGAQPATFETGVPISARAEWNAIGPRLTRRPAPVAANADANVRLRGLVTTVKRGDWLLVTAGGSSSLQRVASVGPDQVTSTTLVSFEANLPQVLAWAPGPPGTASPGSSLNDAFINASVIGHTWLDQSQLVAFAAAQGWSLDALEAGINALLGTAPSPVSVYAMGIDASLFGHNAVDWNTIPAALQAIYADWNSYSLADVSPGLPALDLDNVYPVVAGARAVVQDGGSSFPTTVAGAQELTRNNYLMSAKLTSVTLSDSPADPGGFGLRTTRVLVQTAQLPVADAILDEPVSGGSLILDGAYLSLQVGQLVAVTGMRTDKAGEAASEVVSITKLSLVDCYTIVAFSPELTNTYLRPTVTINANVAPASHGQTCSEILGSGNASQVFQRFSLKQPPLTYVSASTPTAAASTLVLRVNGVEWTEVPWLYGSGPNDRVYTVLTGADGRTYVQFGDGVTGARPSTGTGNIQATYRTGIGSGGLARVGQISMLLSRPLGLKAVINPVISTGAMDPETIDQARPNAPVSVLTLGRIVSLEDVGNFAAASAGVAKAAASWVWDGYRYVACATVAGPAGATVMPGTSQYSSLLQAMLGASDGTLPIVLCTYVAKTFTVAASITPDPALDSTAVLAAVKAALAAAFSFASRSFGQPVFASEVIATMQNVPGVVALTLDDFNRSGVVSSGPLNAIPAAAPALGGYGLTGAELLTLEAGPLPRVVLAG